MPDPKAARGRAKRLVGKGKYADGTFEDDLVKPRAFVVLKEIPPAQSDFIKSLQDYVKQKVGLWKYPRWIEIVDDLPKTATGKIQRFKLRASVNR